MTLPLAFLSYSVQNNWLWAFAGLGAGFYWFYRGLRLLQRRRLVLGIPQPKIRNAAIGLVELSGRALGPYSMQAPLSGVPCYYYRSIAWQLKHSGKNSRWEKVADESLHLPFYLEDNSGRLLVDPQDAELDLRRGFQREFHGSQPSSRVDIPTNVASFLVRHGLDSTHQLKLEEYCVQPKDPLFILGTVAPNPGIQVSTTPVARISDDPISFTFNLTLPDSLPDASPASAAATLPTLARDMTNRPSHQAELRGAPEVIRLQGSHVPSSSTKMSQQEKFAAALIRAGALNPSAWVGVEVPAEEPEPVVPLASAVGAPAVSAPNGTGAATAPAADHEAEFDLTPKTVVLKDRNHSPFFISWRSQREVVQALGWKSTLMIWGGSALSLVSLFILLQHFGCF